MRNADFIKAKMTNQSSKNTRLFVKKFIENLFCNEIIDESEFMSLVSVLEVWRSRNPELLQNVLAQFGIHLVKISKEIRQLFCVYNFRKKKLKIRKYVKLRQRPKMIGNL